MVRVPANFLWEVFLILSFLKGIVRVQPKPLDQKIPPQEAVVVYRSYQSDQPPTLSDVVAGPSVPGPGVPSMPQTRVYHYVNPSNGNHVTSLLPPDHPEMVCMQRGSHVEETKFGLLGEFLFSHTPSPPTVLMRIMPDRCHRGHRLVPVWDWVVSLGQDRYLQTVWRCNQGTAFDSPW